MMEWRPLIWAQVVHQAGIELPAEVDAARRAWLENQRRSQVMVDSERTWSYGPGRSHTDGSVDRGRS